MATVAEKFSIDRNVLIKMLQEMGWQTVHKKNNTKLLDLIPQLRDVDDENKNMTESGAKLLTDILAAEEGGAKFEVTGDDSHCPGGSAKPAAAKKPLPGDDEDDETEAVKAPEKTKEEKAQEKADAKAKSDQEKADKAEAKAKSDQAKLDAKVTASASKMPLVPAEKVAVERVIKHDKISAVLRAKHCPEGPLTVDEAKKLIGWTEVDAKEANYKLKDKNGIKIQLVNAPTNRPFKMPLAERYANEMLRRKWALNLETIVFNCLGNTEQGQHRLSGFILAEQERQADPVKWGQTPLTLEVLLGFGVDDSDEVADTYDTGTKRSLGDVFYRRHDFGGNSDVVQKAVAKVLAGAVRLVWLRTGGKQIGFAPHFPHSEATEFFGKHPGILECCTKIMSMDTDKNLSSLISPSFRILGFVRIGCWA